MAGSAAAQKLDLNFPNLAAAAKEKAEVDLDGDTLAAARGIAGAKAPAGAFSGVKKFMCGTTSFGAPGAYANSEIDPLRKQVAADASWSRIVSVQEKNESTQVYLLKPGADSASTSPGGLLVIATEPKEVTVVELLGSVDLAHLARLQELVQSSISYDLKSAAARDTKK